MGDDVAGSIIGTVGNIAGSLISGHQNYRNTKKLMAYQNQMNIENWKRENQYNSPGAQMARLREAGLNPSLVYSSGTENTGGSINSSSPASMAGNIDLSHVGTDAVNTYLNAKMNQQQLENMRNQNDMLKAQMNEVYQRTLGQIFQNKRESAYLPHYKQMADMSVAATMANLSGLGLSNQLRRGQIAINERSLTEIGERINYMRKQGIQIDASIAQNWARIAIDRALADSNISVNNETKNKIISETANNIRNGNLMSLELDLKRFEFDIAKNSKLESNGSFVQNVLSGIYNNMVIKR